MIGVDGERGSGNLMMMTQLCQPKFLQEFLEGFSDSSPLLHQFALFLNTIYL